MKSTEDIVVVKLKANSFDLDRNTYIINVYDSPKMDPTRSKEKVWKLKTVCQL